MYSFIKLDEDQLHRRRQFLDNYGFAAQISVVVPIVVIQIHYLCAWVQQKQRVRQSLNGSSSPARKSAQFKRHDWIRRYTEGFSKVVWWSGDHVAFLGCHLGTKGELIGGVAWFAWLLLLCFLQTGDDYMHLTKRFGIVGASQLPFHYLLSVKKPYSPLQYVNNASHETLNFVHQSLGRVITILFYLHTAFYLNFFIQSSILISKLSQAYVICGLAAAIAFSLVGTSALATVRQWNYRLFLGTHITLSIVVLPILYFHVHHIRIYVYEAIVILLLNVTLRSLSSKTYADANVTIIPQTNLVQVAVPTSSTTERWMAGQHAYISLPGQALKTLVAKNPFSLSSVPAVDHQLRFVARIHSGNTTALASAASFNQNPQRIILEGPYGVGTHPDRLLTYDRILMIAGGIGGTFIMPLYRQLLADLSPSRGSYRRQKISAVWIAKSKAETAWATPIDAAEQISFSERLSVFLTGAKHSIDTDANVGSYKKHGSDEIDEDGVEMEERANLLSNVLDDTKLGLPDLKYNHGRPNLARIVEQAFSHDPNERVAVVVCGPYALGEAVRKDVGHWVYKGRDVSFWNESFSL